MELVRAGMPFAVVLDRHPAVRPGEVDPRDESPVVGDNKLGDRLRDPGQHESDPQSRLGWRGRAGIGERGDSKGVPPAALALVAVGEPKEPGQVHRSRGRECVDVDDRSHRIQPLPAPYRYAADLPAITPPSGSTNRATARQRCRCVSVIVASV